MYNDSIVGKVIEHLFMEVRPHKLGLSFPCHLIQRLGSWLQAEPTIKLWESKLQNVNKLSASIKLTKNQRVSKNSRPK